MIQINERYAYLEKTTILSFSTENVVLFGINVSLPAHWNKLNQPAFFLRNNCRKAIEDVGCSFIASEKNHYSLSTMFSEFECSALSLGVYLRASVQPFHQVFI